MPVEAKTWTRASRRSQNGTRAGIHVYIDSDTLNYTLSESNISLDSELEIRRYALKGDKGVAKILIKIREAKDD